MPAVVPYRLEGPVDLRNHYAPNKPMTGVNGFVTDRQPPVFDFDFSIGPYR